MKNTKTYSSALAVERSSEAERSEAAPTGVGIGRPNPEVVARAERRIFTGEYKQRVLAEADKAKDEFWRHRRPAPAGRPVLFSSDASDAPLRVCFNAAVTGKKVEIVGP